MKKALILLLFSAATASICHAQLLNTYAYPNPTPGLVEGIVVEEIAYFPDGMAGNSPMPPGTKVYRMYVDMLRPVDRLTFFGAQEGCTLPMEFTTTTGFYNHSFGGNYAYTISSSLFGFFIGLQYDSWLTLEAEDNLSDCPGIAPAPIVGDYTCTTQISSTFDTNPGLNFCQSNVHYGALVSGPSCGYGQGPENLVLIGQFATDGEFGGA